MATEHDKLGEELNERLHIKAHHKTGYFECPNGNHGRRRSSDFTIRPLTLFYQTAVKCLNFVPHPKG